MQLLIGGILNINLLKKENDKIYINSEAVILEINGNEKQIQTNDIAIQKCPRYDYFQKILSYKKCIRTKKMDDYKLNETLIKQIFFYAKNDA